MIGEAKLKLRNDEGSESLLILTKEERSYITALSGGGTRLVHGIADLGVTQRGQPKRYVLIYYPKAIMGDAFDPKTIVAAGTPVEIVP